MNATVRQIEVDPETADLLEARAAARGMSVSALLADMACNEAILPPDLTQMRVRVRVLGCPRPYIRVRFKT